MPYMKIKTSKSLSDAQVAVLQEKLDDAIKTVPGKELVMIELTDNQRFFVKGKPIENIVYAEMHIIGDFPHPIKKRLTEAVFAIFTEVLGTDKKEASFVIIEHATWGGFGEYQDRHNPSELFHRLNPGIALK